MEIGNVQKREITREMEESYLDYAMSVIISRALPDVRDGLKPVHRRVLFAMHEMGLSPGAKYRKCAAIIGDTMGKYHPHGDAPIYEALVRMAQSFSLRYPLADGQGNFGSIDGDAAAAFRYTEARLTSVAQELLADLEKQTVPFNQNYDATRQEPSVLPAKLPNLLLNGSMGIAVGMATNIPPHNLTEVIDAAVFILDNPEADSEDLFKIIPGPDFPTGGIIYGKKDVAEAYALGRGSFVVRGKTEIVDDPRGKGYQIVISEIPYQVEKAGLITKMAELVQEKKIEGVRDIRDESDREGMRIAIDLKHDSAPQKVLNRLYKFTDLQKTYYLNMLAIVDGIQPEVLPLAGVLENFVKHRKHVVYQRTKFDLEKTKDRIHILAGLKKALDHIDLIIKLIRGSKTKEDAHAALRARFKFSDVQASAILAMPLAALAGLERKKIDEELTQKEEFAKKLEAILKSPKLLVKVLKEELLDLRSRFGDARRTKIVSHEVQELSEEDLVPEEDVVVVLTQDGSIKRMDPTQFRVQQRGGKGVAGLALREEDKVAHFTLANTHDALLLFTTRGRVFRLMTYEIPEAARQSKGKAIVNFLSLDANEGVAAILPVQKNGAEQQFVLMATRKGLIKKTEKEAFENVRKNGLMAIALKKDDMLFRVAFTAGSDSVMLATNQGQGIMFSEKDARPMGRVAAGVRGIGLKAEDIVVGMEVLQSKKSDKDEHILTVMENGFGKKTKLSQFRKQRRGGRGIKIARITQKTGSIVSIRQVSQEQEELIAISQRGQIVRTQLSEIPMLGRATQGVRIMRLEQGDGVASFLVL